MVRDELGVEAPSASAPGLGTVPVVLVVDDEPDVRFVLRVTLSHAGYEVVDAAHGGEALDRITQSRPNLIITDLMMPVLDGRELIRRLRADPETRNIPIIQVSNRADPQLATDAAFAKPVRSHELLGVARSLIEESR